MLIIILLTHNQFLIKILDKKVDYSNCRRDFNFNNVKFELNLISIYYIGDSLEFIKGC